MCCGTGCIALLFHHLWQQEQRCSETLTHTALEILGCDISPDAVSLARHNRDRIVGENTQSIQFVNADVFERSKSQLHRVAGAPSILESLQEREEEEWDVLISNPPYISPESFNHTTSRSVRNFEPQLALVPPLQPQCISSPSPDVDQGDLFYSRLLMIAKRVNAKVVLFEVADIQQARRVAEVAKLQGIWDGIEIWRDQPDMLSQPEQPHRQGSFVTRGSGNGRGVLCWRGVAGSWLDGLQP